MYVGVKLITTGAMRDNVQVKINAVLGMIHWGRNDWNIVASCTSGL